MPWKESARLKVDWILHYLNTRDKSVTVRYVLFEHFYRYQILLISYICVFLETITTAIKGKRECVGANNPRDKCGFGSQGKSGLPSAFINHYN
jgi:hypothetical protein